MVSLEGVYDGNDNWSWSIILILLALVLGIVLGSDIQNRRGHVYQITKFLIPELLLKE